MAAGRTLAQIAAARTDLTPEQVAHCELLLRDLGLLADLAFADLVLWLPVWNQGGYVAAAQVRPTTAATRYPIDLVGTFSPRGRRPELDRAWVAPGVGQLAPRVDGLLPVGDEASRVGMSRNGPPIAVLTRSSGSAIRASGALERAYLQAADEIFAMIRVGDFPHPDSTEVAGTEARVGDGLIRVDPQGVVVFASPNAASAFRRIGLAADLHGTQLAQIVGRFAQRSGSLDERLALVAGGQVAGEAEIGSDVANVTLRSIPLTADESAVGALLLVRDVTELRRRERALISKDATIREIHHRVKNNLQTVAALLRLQARRIEEPAAAAALVEAERRVSAIAVVHDLLAQEVAEDVAFDVVADRLLELVQQTASPESEPRRFVRSGTFATIPAATATALSMALVEVLANAVEHGSGDVVLVARRHPRDLQVTVSDRGPGFPEDLDIHRSPRLGLRIVATLIVGELRGSLSQRRTAGRTQVQITIPT